MDIPNCKPDFCLELTSCGIDGLKVLLEYNFEDEPFISFECYFVGESEKFDADILASKGFNVPMISFSSGGFKIYLEDNTSDGIYLWLEKDGKEILRSELLVPILDDKAIITEDTDLLLTKLRDIGALDLLYRALKYYLVSTKCIIKIILRLLREEKFRAEVYNKIRNKDLELCRNQEPECFYSMEEFMKEIKLIGRSIPQTNELIRKLLAKIRKLRKVTSGTKP